MGLEEFKRFWKEHPEKGGLVQIVYQNIPDGRIAKYYSFLKPEETIKETLHFQDVYTFIKDKRRRHNLGIVLSKLLLSEETWQELKLSRNNKNKYWSETYEEIFKLFPVEFIYNLKNWNDFSIEKIQDLKELKKGDIIKVETPNKEGYEKKYSLIQTNQVNKILHFYGEILNSQRKKSIWASHLYFSEEKFEKLLTANGRMKKKFRSAKHKDKREEVNDSWFELFQTIPLKNLKIWKVKILNNKK